MSVNLCVATLICFSLLLFSSTKLLAQADQNYQSANSEADPLMDTVRKYVKGLTHNEREYLANAMTLAFYTIADSGQIDLGPNPFTCGFFGNIDRVTNDLFGKDFDDLNFRERYMSILAYYTIFARSICQRKREEFKRDILIPYQFYQNELIDSLKINRIDLNELELGLVKSIEYYDYDADADRIKRVGESPFPVHFEVGKTFITPFDKKKLSLYLRLTNTYLYNVMFGL